MSDASKPIVGSWTERHISGRVASHGGVGSGGLGGAAKESFGEMKNAFTSAGEGNRMKGFARIGAVGVGATIAAGALRSRDADGNERSGLARVGQAVLGGGMAAAGVLAGGR